MEIKGKVHYVGVNDRNKALFENLWPLPYGVSYNSYLIDDEMVALVDTVDVCYFEVYLKKIRSIIGDKPINYLIINHMEPDHSGSIALIKKYYPLRKHPRCLRTIAASVRIRNPTASVFRDNGVKANKYNKIIDSKSSRIRP